jgi:serine/threonine-protein kinase
VGLPKDEAETALTDLGFVPKIDYESSGDVPVDQVISQQPEPGEEVDEGSVVAFVVSRGPNVVTVPDVVGKKRADAEKALRDAKFKVSVSQQFSESIASGVVISQNPNKGFEGTEGSTVSIVVSKGPERSTVPDLVGKTEAQARDLIKKAKLEAQVTYFLTENSGKVVEQLPASGTKVPPGSVVEILIDGESGQADE